MLLTSSPFLFFLAIIAIVTYAIPNKFRWALLLLASYYFYSLFNPYYALMLLVATAITFLTGNAMSISIVKSKAAALLTLGILCNLGMLIVFKYYNFFAQNTSILATKFHPAFSLPLLKIAIPVGISFYTFKALSYLIDIYRGTAKPHKHPGHFALYLVFFPQILAGPIERSSAFLTQLTKHRFSYERVASGLRLLLWGLCVKMLIADRIANIVNQVYDSPTLYNGPALILATYLYAMQIYFDFAGYSDIAIGAARILGFDTMLNFQRPYFAKTISDFWRRWHISLSSWFRDYLYISLGGNRVNPIRWGCNVVVVFLVSGLWHGASWTFIIWGALHGLYLVFSRLSAPFRSGFWKRINIDQGSHLRTALSIAVTFNLACFSWIFFRANSLSDSWYIVSHLFSGFDANILAQFTFFTLSEIVVVAIGIALVLTVQILQSRISITNFILEKPVIFRWVTYALLALALLNWRPISNSGFIYLQF